MAFARVQGGSNQDWSGGSVTTVTATVSAIGSGNLVSGYVTASGNMTDLQVKDGAGNSCTMGTVVYDATNNQTAQSFYKANITNAPTTFILSRVGATNLTYAAIVLDEFSGVATSSPLTGTPAQQAQTSPGTGTDAITSGTTTPGANGALIYGWTQNDSGSTLASAGTGYTSATSNATIAGRTEYLTQGTAAAKAATFTVAANEAHITGVMAFLPAATSATTTAGQCSYAFTPQNVATKPAFGQTSNQASYAFTPQNVATSKTTASITAIGQASYAFTPQNVTTTKSATYLTTIAQASYAFTPQNIATSRTKTVDVYWGQVVGNVGYGIEWGVTSGGPYSTGSATVGVDVLTYAITGLADRTTYFWRVQALPDGVWSAEGAFTTGIDPFIAEQASYSFTPQSVGTQAGRIDTAVQASYTLTPQNINTKSTFVQTSDQASYAFTPQNIATTTIRSFITTADVGSYNFSPQDVTTRQSATIEPVEQASYAFTPQNIATSLIKAYVMAADQAGYTLTPQNVLTVAFLSRILAVGYALYSFTPYGVAIPGEVTPGNAVRRRNNRALAARLWRNKQELARKLFGM